jgi:excisionase family DNA binding protein
VPTYAARPRRVLTVGDVAELAQVDEATVRRAVHAGALPALRLAPGGRLLRFRPGDVAAWLGDDDHEDDDAA